MIFKTREKYLDIHRDALIEVGEREKFKRKFVNVFSRSHFLPHQEVVFIFESLTHACDCCHLHY